MELKTDSLASMEKNPISAFMEYGQARKLKSSLEVLDRNGPDNEPTFTVAAYLDEEMICIAESKRVKDGREQAAEKALRILFSSNSLHIPSRLQITEDEEESSPVHHKDPVSALMEYAQTHGKTAKFEKLQTTGPAHQPKFTLVAVLDGEAFEAVTGGQLKQLKKKAAIKALNTIEKRTGYFSQHCSPPGGSSPSTINGDMDDHNDVCPPGKNPISVFMEYAQEKGQAADFKEVMVQGLPHLKSFTFAAYLDDEQFPVATGSNKKEAKRSAAIKALKTLQEKGLYGPAGRSANASNTCHAVLCQTFEDKLAAFCQQKFNELVADVPDDLRGRKVIAAIVSIDAFSREIKIVSMGSGNRCITGDKLSMFGNVINDSHAEIIAKRGFRRFLYHSVSAFLNGRKDTVLEESSHGKYRVKEGVRFHLYISTAPCGDGAVFTHSDTSERIVASDKRHVPIYDNAKQGQLRTKIEKGEGTIPVGEDNDIQSWDGIRRGERLRTMSCSDKICSWNVLGLQGALLSNLIDPVYLESITLGQLYSHGHLCRAVCCRVDKQDIEFSLDLPKGYTVSHPNLGQVTAYSIPRNTEKSRAFSINWNIFDEDIEVTDGTTGLRVQTVPETPTRILSSLKLKLETPGTVYASDDKSSRLSKANLYKCYKIICSNIKKVNLIGKTYRDSKQIAASYQRAKFSLKARFVQEGYGKWLTKPSESELFDE